MSFEICRLRFDLRGSSPTIDAGGRVHSYSRMHTYALCSDAASAIKFWFFASIYIIIILSAPLVEPVFLGDSGRRLRKGMSSGDSPVCLYLFVCLSLIKSPGAGAVPQAAFRTCCGGASIRVRGSTPPACGLWPSASRTIRVCSYGFRPVEVLQTPVGGTTVMGGGCPLYLDQNLAPS